MKNVALWGILVLCGLQASAQTPDAIVGRYERDDGMFGFYIDIRGDGTFSYVHLADLAVERTSGRWRLVGPNLLAVDSDATQRPSRITSARRDHPGSVVTVEAGDGSPLPGASIYATCSGRDREFTSDKDGIARISDCSPTRLLVDLSGFARLTADIKGTDLNHHRVVLEVELFLLKNARWLVYEGRLYLLGNGIPRATVRGRDQMPNKALQPTAPAAIMRRRG